MALRLRGTTVGGASSLDRLGVLPFCEASGKDGITETRDIIQAGTIVRLDTDFIGKDGKGEP